MSATVFTTFRGRRFHFDRQCWALVTGREVSGYLAFERGYGYDDRRPLFALRTRSNLGAALLGFTACRVCVPPALALPATGETFGHKPVRHPAAGERGWPHLDVCARCGWNDGTVPVIWPCTSAVVLGLVPRCPDCGNGMDVPGAAKCAGCEHSDQIDAWGTAL